MNLSQKDLTEICLLIKTTSGFFIEDKKINDLRLKVLKRMQILNSGSIKDYIKKLKQFHGPDETGEITLLTASILNHHTYFFRDIEQYVCLVEYCLPEIKGYRSIIDFIDIKIWSAACSTGEEPFSISMILNSILKNSWTFHIDATDIDQPSLNIAQKGVYDERIASNIPVSYLNDFFEKINGGYKIKKQIKKNISFKNLNLIEEKSIKKMKHYDVIFCNNVLFYFDESTQNKIILQLCSALREGGFIFFNGQSSIESNSILKMKKFGKSIVYQKGNQNFSKKIITPVKWNSSFSNLFYKETSSHLSTQIKPPALKINFQKNIVKTYRQLTTQDFIDIKEAINTYSGLYLIKKHHESIKSHIKFRMIENKLIDKVVYMKKLLNKNNQYELKKLVELLMNHETDFFREYDQLILISEKCIPIIRERQKLEKNKHIESLCIGCSTGEEAYTLAILFNEMLSDTPEFTSHVLATDIVQNVLDIASKGVYKKELIQNVPEIYLQDYFTPLSKGYSLNLNIRKGVSFDCQNLIHIIKESVYNTYDFIFCRNVLTKFDRKSQIDIFESLYNALKLYGFLVIESNFPYDVISDYYPFTLLGNGIYQKKIY